MNGCGQAQLEILNNALTEDESLALKTEISKLKLLQKQMEEDAEQGTAIQGPSRQPSEVTPLKYLSKSATSIAKYARESGVLQTPEDSRGWIEQIRAFMTVCIVLSLLVSAAFTPSH